MFPGINMPKGCLQGGILIKEIHMKQVSIVISLKPIGRQILIKGNSGPNSGTKMYHKGAEGHSQGNLVTQKRMNIRDTQRVLHSSDADNARKHVQQIKYDSPHSGNSKSISNAWF